MPSNILKIATNKIFTKCTVLPRVRRKRATGQGNMGGGGGASYSNLNHFNVSSLIIITIQDRYIYLKIIQQVGPSA